MLDCNFSTASNVHMQQIFVVHQVSAESYPDLKIPDFNNLVRSDWQSRILLIFFAMILKPRIFVMFFHRSLKSWFITALFARILKSRILMKTQKKVLSSYYFSIWDLTSLCFLRSNISFSSFFLIFFEIRQCLPRLWCVNNPSIIVLSRSSCSIWNQTSLIFWRSDIPFSSIFPSVSHSRTFSFSSLPRMGPPLPSPTHRWAKLILLHPRSL